MAAAKGKVANAWCLEYRGWMSCARRPGEELMSCACRPGEEWMSCACTKGLGKLVSNACRAGEEWMDLCM